MSDFNQKNKVKYAISCGIPAEAKIFDNLKQVSEFIFVDYHKLQYHFKNKPSVCFTSCGWSVTPIPYFKAKRS